MIYYLPHFIVRGLIVYTGFYHLFSIQRKIILFFWYISKMSERNIEYYEGTELEALVNSIDWPKFLSILHATTRRILYKRYMVDPERGLFGKTYEDFVHDALRGFLEGVRKCPKDTKIEVFFYWTIRSIISHHAKEFYSLVSIETTEDEVLEKHYSSIKIKYDREVFRNKALEKIGSDVICKEILECWLEGIDTPAEIRELLGYSEADYNKGRKRLITALKDFKFYLQ